MVISICMAKTQNRNYATNSEWEKLASHHSQTDSKKKSKWGSDLGFNIKGLSEQ